VVVDSTKIFLWMMENVYPLLPKKTLQTLNEEQRMFDFYQTFKSKLLRWGVLERSKLFENCFANAIKDHRKASELYWEIVTRHQIWSAARVLSRLIKRIDDLDEEETAREFERLAQGNKESIMSFRDHFTEAANAYRIFFQLTEKQEMNNFITKLRVGNHKQLKLLRIKTDCVEDIFDVIETFETSQRIGQRHRSVNFNKTYKNRYDKKNKKRLQKKRESHREVNAMQKAGKDASKSQPQG